MKRSAEARSSSRDPYPKGHKQTTEVETSVNSEVGLIRAPKWAKSRFTRAFGASRIFCYSSWMSVKSLFADPNILQVERISSEPDRPSLIPGQGHNKDSSPKAHGSSASVMLKTLVCRHLKAFLNSLSLEL